QPPRKYDTDGRKPQSPAGCHLQPAGGDIRAQRQEKEPQNGGQSPRNQRLAQCTRRAAFNTLRRVQCLWARHLPLTWHHTFSISGLPKRPEGMKIKTMARMAKA